MPSSTEYFLFSLLWWFVAVSFFPFIVAILGFIVLFGLATLTKGQEITIDRMMKSQAVRGPANLLCDHCGQPPFLFEFKPSGEWLCESCLHQHEEWNKIFNGPCPECGETIAVEKRMEHMKEKHGLDFGKPEEELLKDIEEKMDKGELKDGL